MAHELTIRETGKVEMAYTGNVPWHGLGNVLQPGASIDTWVEAAGMNWRIKRGRVRYATGRDQDTSEYSQFDDRVVLFREDNKAPLGIVSDGFQIVQPREVFEFFRDLTESAGMELETAGTLFGGRKFWAMSRLKNADMIVADKRDTIKQNLLLATACDGSMATEGAWIATRVFCNNTLQIGRHEKQVLKVKINHRSEFDHKRVKAELGIEAAQSVFAKTVATMRELASLKMSPQNVVLATATLFHPEFATLGSDKQQKVLRSKPVTTIGELALDGTAIGADMAGMKGTAYGWLNAVTQYIDHQGRARSNDARLDAAWFGKGADIKDRALELVTAGSGDRGAVPKGVSTSLHSGGSAVDSVNAWLATNGGSKGADIS